MKHIMRFCDKMRTPSQRSECRCVNILGSIRPVYLVNPHSCRPHSFFKLFVCTQWMGSEYVYVQTHIYSLYIKIVLKLFNILDPLFGLKSNDVAR